MGRGAHEWLIPDGYLPSKGKGKLNGHETISILNTDSKEANAEIDVYFEDRDPIKGIKIRVPGERTRHIRLDKPELLGGNAIPRETSYAVGIRSDRKIVVQQSRLDVTQKNLALFTTIAYPISEKSDRKRERTI